MLPTNWMEYRSDAIAGNVNLPWADIVGSSATVPPTPATYYYPDFSSISNSISFRMRLKGNPIKDNPDKYELRDFVWGVQLRDTTNSVLFTAQVNARAKPKKLQVIYVEGNLTYSDDIVMHRVEEPNDNVRVSRAVAQGNLARQEDEEYFLDFTVPVTSETFLGYDLTSGDYRFCYYTSTNDDGTINTDSVCGVVLNAAGPMLTVTKEIIDGPRTLCVNKSATWRMRVTINNSGTGDVDAIALGDTINPQLSISSISILPSLGPLYIAPDQIQWAFGSLHSGETQTLEITLTGSFAAQGQQILDSGLVTSTIPTIEFSDTGVSVLPEDAIKVTALVSGGPSTIEKCVSSVWTLSVAVENTSRLDITGLIINDVLSSNFSLDMPAVITSSTGTITYNYPDILWSIDVLPHNQTATLQIVLNGYFCDEGLQIFNKGTAFAGCGNIQFQDVGVNVLPIAIKNKINVSGQLKECKTGVSLTDVTVRVYSSCKLLKEQLFSNSYSLQLDSGIYTLEFVKEGYERRFLALILESDSDVSFDINLVKEVPSQTPGPVTESAIDLFVGIIKEKFNVDIIYNKFLCVCNRIDIENVSDYIDSINWRAICGKKFILDMVMENNIVGKIDGTKQLKFFTKPYSLCFPTTKPLDEYDYKYSIKILKSRFCRDGNKVYNFAHMKYVGYFICYEDASVNGVPESECK
ncbi:MAG TPA: hypothetical protein VF941_24385 [Clostridia bacterium]